MLNDKEQRELKTYEAQLQKPKWKAIIFYGFAFIFLLLLISTAYEYFSKGKTSLLRETPARFLARIVSYLVAGFVYGLFMRMIIQNRYNKLKEKQSATGN